LKTIEKPIRCGAYRVWKGDSGFPLARPEDSVRCLPKFSRKSTNARSNRRHLTHGTGPKVARSQEREFVLKAGCEYDGIRTDAGEDTKDDVVIVPGYIDGDKMDHVVSDAKGGFQNPTGDVPSESSTA